MADFKPNIPLEQVKSSVLDKLLDTLIPFRRRTRRLVQDNERLEAFLRAVPIEYCGWDQAGVQAISPGFCGLFGLENVESLEDIQSAVTAGDAAALEGLFERLKQYGENFDIGVNALSGKRTLKVFGKQGAMGDGSQVFSVIWAYDITDFAQAAMRSMEAVTTVEKRENELRSALNALPFPVWLRNAKLDLTWCNRVYARIIDDTGAAVIADQKDLPLTGAGKESLSQRVLAQRAVATQAPQQSRGHAIVDGQRRLLEMIEIPLVPEKKMVGIALDVTREEEWESSYKRLATSHREALQQLRTAIAMFDVDNKLEFYNGSCRTWYTEFTHSGRCKCGYTGITNT